MRLYRIAHYEEGEQVKDKKSYIFYVIFLIISLCCGCRTNLHSKEEKFIDYNVGVETLSDEEAIKLVKEIIAFMDTGIETGEDVEGFNGENFAYFKNKEDESILESYHRNYIKDVAYNYLIDMYGIRRFKLSMGEGMEEFQEIKNLDKLLTYMRKLTKDGEYYLYALAIIGLDGSGFNGRITFDMGDGTEHIIHESGRISIGELFFSSYRNYEY